MTPSTRSVLVAKVQRTNKSTKYIAIAICAAVIIGAGVTVAVIRPWSTGTTAKRPVHYLGLYEPDTPYSYAGVNKFADAVGRQPNLVSYYSSWTETFQSSFARLAAAHGALTVVQMDPKDVSLARIAAGRYDSYLRSYAATVKAFGNQVVLSFGHEMNGSWYSWGNQHTSAEIFVAAWRHIVNLFRAVGATNVTWLWTVNIINAAPPIPAPNPWWPGRSYVDWVGIDGYYYLSSQTFSQVFGPTIVDVRGLTNDPILIAETGASPEAGQPAKIDDLFAGVSTYGLLGFVWFDENTQGRVWRIGNPAAFSAFGRDAEQFMRSAVSSTPNQHASANSGP